MLEKIKNRFKNLSTIGKIGGIFLVLAIIMCYIFVPTFLYFLTFLYACGIVGFIIAIFIVEMATGEKFK